MAAPQPQPQPLPLRPLCLLPRLAPKLPTRLVRTLVMAFGLTLVLLLERLGYEESTHRLQEA